MIKKNSDLNIEELITRFISEISRYQEFFLELGYTLFVIKHKEDIEIKLSMTINKKTAESTRNLSNGYISYHEFSSYGYLSISILCDMAKEILRDALKKHNNFPFS